MINDESVVLPRLVSEIIDELYREERNLSGRIQRLRPKICPFNELLPLIPENSRVLDVGCGSGLWAGLLVKTGRASSVYGFDASEKAIAVAKRMRDRLSDAEKEKLFFEYRSVVDGLPEERFDVVTMIDVAHHIPVIAQQKAISDTLTRVKPGGLFLYKDMAEKPYFCAMMNRLHDMASAGEWIHYCPIQKVEETCLNAKAVIEQASSKRLYWYQHEWRLFRLP